MPRSISTRLILAFVLVSVTGVALAAGISNWLTQREFMQLFVDQARDRFLADAVLYYQTNGAWEGVADSPRFRAPPPPPDEPADAGPTPVPRQTARRPVQAYFALADQEGVVIVAAGDLKPGDVVPAARLSSATPVEVGGARVGSVVSAGAPALGPLELQYLDRTNRALLYAAIGAVLVAVLLGAFLARTLTQPLRELTAAIRGVAGGDLRQRVRVSSSDELGQLAAAFNQMSADLDRLIQSRRQMTADIAHDLRTPLTVIGGYVESMRDGVLKPTRERLALVGEEVQHLQRLVEDLRTLFQADAGELRMNCEPVAPAGLLKRMAQTFQPLADKQGVALAVDATPDLPRVTADPDRLAQMFGNLITNALRYTPRGGTIEFRARRENGRLVMEVRDNGRGIEPSALPFVFDRFYRADVARGASGESGLGLAIAKSIVEAHGGAISAQSTLGRGTTIAVTLPL